MGELYNFNYQTVIRFEDVYLNMFFANTKKLEDAIWTFYQTYNKLEDQRKNINVKHMYNVVNTHLKKYGELAFIFKSRVLGYSPEINLINYIYSFIEQPIPDMGIIEKLSKLVLHPVGNSDPANDVTSLLKDYLDYYYMTKFYEMLRKDSDIRDFIDFCKVELDDSYGPTPTPQGLAFDQMDQEESSEYMVSIRNFTKRISEKYPELNITHFELSALIQPHYDQVQHQWVAQVDIMN